MGEIELPPDGASVAAVRRFVDEQLGPRPGADEVVLMASELVGNVVRHASTDVLVRLSVGPPIRVEVTDGVAATDAFRALVAAKPAAVSPSAGSGRGLWIVHELASRIGLEDATGGGKTVWFEWEPPEAAL